MAMPSVTDIHPKVQAGGVGFFLATVVLSLLGQYANYHPDQVTTEAIIGLFTFAAAYIQPATPKGA